MPDPLSDIRSKIKWTEKRVSDLQAALRAFLDPNPYEVGTKRDPDTRKLIYYIVRTRDVPCDVTHLAAECMSSMISTLDHLAYQLWIRSGSNGDGLRVQFPISREAPTLQKHKSDSKGKVKGIRNDIRDALFNIEAYEGGKGHDLWVINELNNLAKHRELITVGSHFRGMDVGKYLLSKMDPSLIASFPTLSHFLHPADTMCPLKVGDELFIDLPDAEPNENLKFTFEVAISEPQIVKPQSLIETIHQLAGFVSKTVDDFASELS